MALPAIVFPTAVDEPVKFDANFDANKLFFRRVDTQIRSIERQLVRLGSIGGAYANAADAISLSLLSSGAQVQIPLAHPYDVATNTSISGNAVAVSQDGPLSIRARVNFTAPAGPTNVLFVICRNGAPISDSITPTKYTAAGFITAFLETLVLAEEGDVFAIYAYTSGAGGTTTLAIASAGLVVSSPGGSRGPPGVKGDPGPSGAATAFTEVPSAITSTALDPTVNTWGLADTSSNDVSFTMPNAGFTGNRRKFTLWRGGGNLIVASSSANLEVPGAPGTFTNVFQQGGAGFTVAWSWSTTLSLWMIE